MHENAQVFSHWISDICLREEKEKEEVALLPGMRAQPPTGRDAFINAITVAAIQSTSTSIVTNASFHSCISYGNIKSDTSGPKD